MHCFKWSEAAKQQIKVKNGEFLEGSLIVAVINSKLAVMAMGIKVAFSTQLNMTTVLEKDEQTSAPLIRSWSKPRCSLSFTFEDGFFLLKKQKKIQFYN